MGVSEVFLREARIGLNIEVVVGPKIIIGTIVSLDQISMKVRKTDNRTTTVSLAAVGKYEFADVTVNKHENISFLEDAYIGAMVEVVIGSKIISGSIIYLDELCAKIKNGDGKNTSVTLDTIAVYEFEDENGENTELAKLEKTQLSFSEESIENLEDETSEIDTIQDDNNDTQTVVLIGNADIIQGRIDEFEENVVPMEAIEAIKDKIEREEIEEEYTGPNVFEVGLIDGDKSVVGGFVANACRLTSLGYSDKEIERIKKMYKATAWGKELFKVATRIYNMQLNKHGLARYYYEKALEDTNKGSVEYKKALNALVKLVSEDGDEAYVVFWKRNATYLKDNVAFCMSYIDAVLRLKKIKINEFEKLIIDADRSGIVALIKNSEMLKSLDYSDSDIERIGKAVKVLNWDSGWYKIATRLYGLQLNKNGLAKVYYEAALIIANKKTDEYTKILNALASIKMNDDDDEFILFFKTYKEKFKTNVNYCMAYANALLAKQNFEQLEKDMKMLQTQISVNPTYLEKLESEMKYYKSLPKFVLSENAVLYKRYIEENGLFNQEKQFLERLPEKIALKALLEIYFFNKEMDAYFALVDYALFYVKGDKILMLKLVAMLHLTANLEYIVELLPRIPVLWCDYDLIKRFSNYVQNNELAQCNMAETRIMKHIRSIGTYRNQNGFEVAIINNDYDEVRRYIDNPYLLEELGYGEDEILDMSALDVESCLTDESYTMKRILAFQGNKNHTAERHLFEAYYYNKYDMCNRLFPLLLDEKRGDLILSIYEFDRDLGSNMSSFKRFYFLALCIVEKNDDIFYEKLESEWMNYQEDEILDRMYCIAQEKGDELLVKQIELQKNKPRNNEFETAIIEADNDTIRKYVKNANLLVELGYTPEEIKKICNIFALGATNGGTKPGQIANRVYLYQKNKNNLAERLYLNAMAEDEGEEILNDSEVLFQIYTAQNNYDMVCKLYEEYLYAKMEEKFNRTYATTYCIALYELTLFEKFADYIRNNKDKWEGFSLAENLLFVSESLGTEEFDDYIWKNLNSSTYRPDIISKYMLNVLDKNYDAIYTDKYAKLVNLFFAYFPFEDIRQIIEKINKADLKQFKMPEAALLAAFVDPKNRDKYLNMWMEHIGKNEEDSRKIDVIAQMDDIFPECKSLIVNRALALYVKIDENSISEYKLATLEDYIYVNVNAAEQALEWNTIQKNRLCRGKGSLHSLQNYLQLLIKNDQAEDFWVVYLLYKKYYESELSFQKMFEIVYYYYDSVKEKLDESKVYEIADELIFLSGEFNLDYIAIKNIAYVCEQCGKLFESRIYLSASQSAYKAEVSDSISGNDIDEIELNYIDYLINLITDNPNIDLVKKCRGWSRYLLVTEDEGIIIERLRNTVKTAALWVKKEVNILAKAILCEPICLIYWKLLQTWIIEQDDNGRALGAVLYQLSAQGDKETESASFYAVKNDLKGIALDLTLRMLDMRMTDFNISAQRNLRLMIEKGWFSEDSFIEATGEIMNKISNNINLTDALNYEWNSVCAAVDLAVTTKKFPELIDSFSEYLSKNCAKQCCVIIASMILNRNYEVIDSIFNCLNISFADVPYKKLVQDFYNLTKSRELTISELKVLECVQMDYGNLLSVNNLLKFYCDMCVGGQRELGIDTIHILMEYTQYDPVLYEVAASFLKEEKNDEKLKTYYEYMYKYLVSSLSFNQVEYALGQMVCGENYLRIKGYDVTSFKKMVEDRYPMYSESVKEYQSFCDNIMVGVRSTEFDGLPEILFKTVFTGDWVEVFEYMPADDNINTLLKQNIKTDRINIANDYSRSVIKSVVLYTIKYSDNMWEIIDNSNRMRFIWDCIGNVGCGYDYFSEQIQALPEYCMEELRTVFALDIETLTVYKKFFGKYIIGQEHCEEYAHIYNVFVNAWSGDIFSNEETQESLKGLDKEHAISICRGFEKLYIRPSGIKKSYATGKSVVMDSDYESNVFSDFLKRNTSDYRDRKRCFERFKDKYELICKMNRIYSIDDANDRRFILNEKRQIFSLRALYFYYAVLSGKKDEIEFITHRYVDVINAITVALSDDIYLADLGDFVESLEESEKSVVGILILAEQEKLDVAAEIAVKEIKGKWKGYVCARLVTAYGQKGKSNPKCEECLAISKKSSIEKFYWIKIYKHAKNIYKIDYSDYINLDNGANIDKECDGVTFADKFTEVQINSNDSVYIEKIDITEIPDDTEDMSYEMPSYIKYFLQATYEEDDLKELQKQWNELKEDVDNGKEVQEFLNELSIKIGIVLIKMIHPIDVKLMGELFGSIKKYSIQDTYLITGLHDILQNYICGYSELDTLARTIYENQGSIKHLCYEQSNNQKSRMAQDIEAATTLIEILIDIANDLSTAMGDEAIKERLRSYQEKLYKETKKTSKFRNTVNVLGKMIQEKINSINNVPYLFVSHLGTVNFDNFKNYNWSEKWLEGADHGAIRGVVLNRGGASAKSITLNVTVNSEIRGTFSIGKIEPGKKIPFVVEYSKSDIVSGKIDWVAEVTYYDEQNNKMRSSNGYGEVHVTLSDEEWGIEHVGREKFNTQFAAEGDEFCGRTNELLRFNNLYNVNGSISRYPSLLVTGLRRAGKSSVIKFFKESLRQRGNLAPIFVDAQGINGDIKNAFFNLVFNELYRTYRREMEEFVEFKKKWEEISKKEDWISQLPLYFIELSELLGDRKVIFILDEMENVFYANHFENAQNEEQFFGMIRSIIQNYQEYVSFIFCGSDKLLTSCLEQKRESQMFQVLQRIYVGRMGINDIRDMFGKYNVIYDVKFGDDAIDAIMYYTNGLIWYTKVIAYNILDRIIDQERILRDEIHVADVDEIVELLISGDLGSELIDLLDNNFGAKRKAIIRAIAKATKNQNESVSIEMIMAELPRINYIDNETGEVLRNIAEDDVVRNLAVLEKMDFIEKDTRKERAFRFTTELYRLLMLDERKIDKFIIVNGGENNG